MKIGVLGGGQLGQMLAQAGVRLGHNFTFLDPSPVACASAVGELILSPFAVGEPLSRLVERSDVLTAEFENVPATVAEAVAANKPIHPGPNAFFLSQNRLREKALFTRLGIETPRSVAVNNVAELRLAGEILGYPFILKTAELGYDGKGQWRIKNSDSLTSITITSPCIAEEFVPFERELSIVGVRAGTGETAFYPVVENIHHEGILIRTTAPALSPPNEEAQSYLLRIMEDLNYVGVCTLELFQLNGRLLANEIAPRVHNSGHWTIEGAECSQFENHIRAISGMQLGSTKLKERSVMLNILGSAPEITEAWKRPNIHLHLYGKSAAPKRKIGHVTITGDDATAVADVFERLMNTAS